MGLKRSQGIVTGVGSAPPNLVESLNDLDDVDTSSPTDKDVLSYSAGTSLQLDTDDGLGGGTGGTTATARDSFNGTVLPDNAVAEDEDTTIWHDLTNASGGWWKLDMGSQVTADRVRVLRDTYTATWQLAGSNNDADWTDIGSPVVTIASSDDTVDFPSAETWRYWRLTNSEATYFTIAEFELWNTDNKWVTATHNVFTQDDTAGAVPVVELEQADVDEDFFKFTGTSDTSVDRALVDAANFTTPGSIVGWLKISLVDEQGTSPITDGDYYIPFYSAPTA